MVDTFQLKYTIANDTITIVRKTIVAPKSRKVEPMIMMIRKEWLEEQSETYIYLFSDGKAVLYVHSKKEKIFEDRDTCINYWLDKYVYGY